MPVTTAAKPTSGPTTVTQGDESMYERHHAYKFNMNGHDFLLKNCI